MSQFDQSNSATRDIVDTVFSQIFGAKWNVFEYGVGDMSDSLLMTVLVVLNMFFLFVLAIIVLWSIKIGAMETAKDGDPGGRGQHTAAFPARLAIAIGILAPIPGTKLSVGIIMILSALGISNWGANKVAEPIYDYMEEHGGMVTIPVDRIDIKPVAMNLLATSIVREYFRIHRDQGYQNYAVRCISRVERSGCENTFTFPAPVGSGIRDGAFGRVSFYCPDGKDGICQVKENAMRILINKMDFLAEKFVSHYRGGENLKVTLTEFHNALIEYDNYLRPQLVELSRHINPDRESKLVRFMTHAKNLGWGSLMFWEWTISHFNESAQARISIKPAFIPMQVAEIQPHAGEMLNKYVAFFGQYIDAYNVSTLATTARGYTGGGSGYSGGSMVSTFIDEITSPFSSGILAPTTIFENHSNPISSAQIYGHRIIDAMWGVVVAGATVKAALDVGEGFADAAADVAGNTSSSPKNAKTLGKILKTGGTFVKSIAESVFTIVSVLLLPMVIAAFFLAYYVPFLSFIIFATAFIKWVVLSIESVVAIGLWAISLALPSPEPGIAGGKRGLMLLMGVMVYPALMVVGKVAGWMALGGTSWLVALGMETYINGEMGGEDPIYSGFISFVAHVVIMTIAFVSLAHLSLNIVSWLSDHLLRWVGGESALTPQENTASDVKAAVMSSGNRVTSGMSQAGSVNHDAVKNKLAEAVERSQITIDSASVGSDSKTKSY